MVNYPPRKGSFAIALSVAAVLWTIPASASEGSRAINETAVAGVIPVAAIVADTSDRSRRAIAVTSDVTRTPNARKSRHARHRWTASGVRRAAYHWQQRIRETLGRSECSGIWCGRNFVMMLGIGF